MFDTVVIASSNSGKIREIQHTLSPLIPHLPTQDMLGFTGAEEPYETFIENALAKARHIAKLSGKPALSDDSGLVVPALNNKPGIHSARYSGENACDEDNNIKLLNEMENITHRQAFYYAIIVFLRCANDPAPIIAKGVWHGEITLSPRGKNGFGYDPLFFDPKVGKTGAEMTLSEKHQHSHRGQSLRNILHQIKEQQQLIKHIS